MSLSFLILFMANSFAAPVCDSVKSPKEFYQCSLERHPDSEISRLKVVEGQALKEKASQWQNPDLELKNVQGGGAQTTEITLSVPVSQIWTNGSKVEIGEAEKKIAEIESSESLLSARKSLVHDLYRLRQIQNEIEVFEESINAFGGIKNLFKGRLAKGPEQEVTLGLVELASSDYELKRSQLYTEKAEIQSRFKVLWGQNFKISSELLPKFRSKWPEFKVLESLTQNLSVQKKIAESERALAEKKLATRESWPEVRLGPEFEQINNGSESVKSYGVNLTMSLPVFSLNTGNRNLASVRAEQARNQAEYARNRATMEREILLQKYRLAIQGTARSENSEDVRKKHQKVDALFKQGMIPGSLVIEAHRQIVDFIQSQHQQEAIAVDAFLELKNLNGESVEEILQ